MELMQGYKQTDIGLFPRDWSIKKLKEITTLLTNGFVGSAKIHYSENDSDVLYIQGYNVLENSFDFHGIKHVTRSFHSQHQKSSLLENDLLTVQTGDVGLTTIVPKGLVGSNCHALIITRYKKNLVDSKYISFFLNSKQGRMRLKLIETGTTMKHLNCGDMLEFQLPLPPLHEQAAIANALSDMDALIAQTEKLIEKKKAIKHGAMQELLKPKEGWVTNTLGDYCQVITKGTTPTSIGKEFQNNGINFLKIESLAENGKIIPEKVAFIDQETHNILKRSQIMKGDILFSIAGFLGRVAIVDEAIIPANTNQALAIIRLKKDAALDSDFLFYYLNHTSIQNHIHQISVQGAQANISLQNIFDFEIWAPRKDVQKSIASLLNDVNESIAFTVSKLTKLKQQKQGMMQALLTGKIRLV